jgi:hypothetical protein
MLYTANHTTEDNSVHFLHVGGGGGDMEGVGTNKRIAYSF